ncbi:zinc finger protein 436-like isoform X2 [Alosa sapidissima]|uniref:zinc finger protein 436-like isoform X2 n=1 Tax=Alosa sapidissima TaxID=34773 RepID=UPI001C0971F0|nr:zinc finger protein 436-like isoform X2 [Alosa sapidissima]
MDQGLQLNSGANDTETHQVQRVVVKEEDIKEEEHEHMIAYQDDEEMPFTEHDCKTEADGAETDVTESSVTYDDETPQQTAEIEVKIEEDDEQELGDLLASVSEGQNRTQQRIHGQNDDELNLRLRGRLHHCAVCRKSFKALTELKSHMLTHSARVNEQQNTGGKNTHICSHCGRTFGRYTQLKRHIRTHTGEKPHKCVQCGRAFSQTAALNSHMLTHTGEKPHRCVHCDKSFTRSTHLKNHMRTHTGEKPHNCAQCGKSFSDISRLQTHMLTHAEKEHHQCDEWRSFFTNFYS